MVQATCLFESSGYSSAISLKVDETGLWAVFCTEESNGLIVIGKLDVNTLEIRRKYVTNLRKSWIEQVFISCGILYGVRSFGEFEHVIKYVYNTHSQVGYSVNIPLSK